MIKKSNINFLMRLNFYLIIHNFFLYIGFIWKFLFVYTLLTLRFYLIFIF